MTRTLRVLRQVVCWPIEWVLPATGQHRLRPVLLPDGPIPVTAEPVPHVVLDDIELEQLLDSGDVVANESAPCPKCKRSTAHAMHRDGSRLCWDCGTPSSAEAA